MKRVYSGIRATGRLHLGNYLGAVKGMLALQDKYDCIFSVVDLHTITVPYEPKTLRQSVRDIILDYLAAGLDPEKCHLEIQSEIPEHTELAYFLSTIYPVSRLEDLPTYKDKKAQYPKYVNMGLLYYPVLMAADILLYKASLVPVGIDQEPHLEVAREIARKFNSMFGQTFPEPERFKTEGEYVPSLLGTGKMSKSVEGSYILLTDDENTITKRLAKMPTASDRGGGEVPREGPVANLFNLFEVVKLLVNQKTKENIEYARQRFTKDYKDGEVSYENVKSTLSGFIKDALRDFQDKRKEFENNPEEVDRIISDGRAESKKIAQETIAEVRQKMGFSQS